MVGRPRKDEVEYRIPGVKGGKFHPTMGNNYMAKVPEDTEMVSLAENKGLLERRVADTLDTLLDDEALKSLIGEALLSTEDVWINCPHCNKRSQAPQPKPMDRVKAFIALRQHAIGLPTQRHEVAVTVRTGVPVGDMTNEELAAIVAGGDE